MGEQELLQEPAFRELLTFLRSAQLEIFRLNTGASPGVRLQGASLLPEVSSVRDLSFLTPWDPEPAGWGAGATLGAHLQGAPHLPQVSIVRDLSF